MYTDRVADTYINKSKLHIMKASGYDLYPLEYQTRINSICRLVEESDKFHLGMPPLMQPDFTVKGRLKAIPPFRNKTFILGGNEHTHQLFITGLSARTQDIGVYRLPEFCFSSYWEDEAYELGFLFQVVELKQT